MGSLESLIVVIEHIYIFTYTLYCLCVEHFLLEEVVGSHRGLPGSVLHLVDRARSQITLIWLSLDCGRKVEYLETCKHGTDMQPHTEKVQLANRFEPWRGQS